MEHSEASQANSTATAVETPDMSIETENFHSVEGSPSLIAVTFNVSAVSEDASLEDETQYTSQVESLIEEEEADSMVTIGTQSQLNVSNTQEAICMETSTTTTEECDERSYFQGSLLELGRFLWETNNAAQCYTKGCFWSPDGTCCLVPVHLDGMHLIELPADLYQHQPSPNRKISKLSTAVHVKEGGTVYDCAWYPFMNSEFPLTCCWLASRQHEPIQMWDAFNGDLRASYRGYDDVDEVEAAISVIFSTDGEHVLGGYKKCIRIFDTDIYDTNNCSASAPCTIATSATQKEARIKKQILYAQRDSIRFY